jgi:hypothetical protein
MYTASFASPYQNRGIWHIWSQKVLDNHKMFEGRPPQDVFFRHGPIWAPARPFHGCFPLCEEPCLCGSIPSWRPKAPQPLISYVWAISAPCQATATKNVAKPQFHENYPQVITNKLGINNAPNGNFILGKKKLHSPAAPPTHLSWKKNGIYVNPDPTSKSCDFQAAVFIFLSRRLILNWLN